ncbi:hypothetical protein F4604DRAFT_2030060 [Suillus subluteus]|nr:hypothetical protein F4604DRAFT_2030060 [Suillus subluteus]
MYPARYESWFATESQESDSQSNCASPILDLDQISYDLDHASWTHNPTLSPIDINARSLDDSINPDTSVLFSTTLPSSIHPTGTQSDASDTAIIPFSDDSDTLPLEPDILLKSNMPADLMRLFSANLIQRRAGTHRQGKKCLKGRNQADSSPSLSAASGSASSISLHFTPSDTSHTINACPGVPIHWPVPGPSFLETFPVGRASAGQGVLPFDIDTRGNIPRAYSQNCAGATTTSMSPCSGCTEVVGFIEHLLSLAQDTKPHTKYRFLSHSDMVNVARQYSAENNRLKLKGLNDARRVSHILTQLDDYKSLIMALLENNIPHLQHILTVALKRGSSIRQIINTLEDSLAGAYHPRGYTGDDLDMAVLAYRLGGRALLHAFSHRLALPSLRTLQAHRNFTSITPTIGPITPDQLDSNIKNLLLNPLSDSSLPRRGYSVLMDEIALEERASHHRASNSVIGLCHSHSHLVDPSLHTYDSALRIAEKLAEGKIHLGKEMSVIAVGSFGDDGIFPVLAAPTCKCEDSEKMISIFMLIRDRWKETGAEEKLGPIFSFAMDGDSTRRAAGHRLFLKTELSMTSKLYGTLSHMQGLNLATGEGEITLDFDYKHIFKHEFSLIVGMKLVNGHTVNRAVLTRYLSWLPDQDETSILKLLNPDDPQDVPRAIELMQAIITLSKNEFDTTTMSVGECADIVAIKILGAVLESILLPFIDVTLSLHQQIAHLSRYAHLTFTFFRLHRSAFMPHVLYYDSQTMVKNACFCVAKQQKLDGSQKFWLIQTGDDRLEKLFGITRMRGQHNSAMNYSQALDRIGAAKDIDTVFKKHPDLESGSRRLKITRVEGLNHIRCDLWVGDVVASHCDLPSAWKDGRDKALTVLTDAHVSAVCCAFNEFFLQDGCDLMRPWGENKYLGITSDIDGHGIESSVNSASGLPILSESILVAGPTSVEEETELDEDVLTLEEALTHDVAFGSPNIDHTIPSTSHPDTPVLVSGPGINPDDYLLVHGKYIHKETICRRVLNKYFIAKSLNRQERVYSTGFTKVNCQCELPGRSITGGDTFIIGDVFLTIIRINLTVTIALVRSTSIEHHSITRHDILASNIRTPDVKLTGQILTLIPTHQPAEQRSWLWTGDYVKTRSEIQGIKQTTEKVVEITVPGLLVELVNPETTCVRMRDDINSDKFFALNNLGNTWIIEELALSLACDTLWRNACEHSISIKNILHIPTPSDPSMFPYALPDGSAGIVCIEASQQLAAAELGPLDDCPLCGVKTDSMRAHIGIHILRASHGIKETLKEEVGLTYPCGFCGQSGCNECKIQIKVSSKGSVSLETRCPYFHVFRYANADIGSKNRPSRNVPLKCELCHPSLTPVTGKKSRAESGFVDAVWCYNMIQHLDDVHPQYAHPKNPTGHPLPLDILNTFMLTSLEQRDASIPKSQWLMPLFDSDDDKENQPGPSTRKRKNKNTGNTNAKKARKSA